jgi:N6-L-threonylcarbamoyladenine synthase
MIDVIAVTVGQGLVGSLVVGVEAAKSLSLALGKPLVPVNHLIGHIYANFIDNDKPVEFPAVALLVSGGHTDLILMKGHGNFKYLGGTLDDAAGEAFDKLAKMLELGYPGGPIVARLAEEGRPIYKLPVPMLQSHDLNFSFSGLKTAALYFLRNYAAEKNRQFICDFCASFEFAVVDSIRRKLEKSLSLFPSKFILCGGGVMNNLVLRKMVRQTAKKHGITAYFPPKKVYNSDNAAMIAVAGFYKSKRGEFEKDISTVDRRPNWEIDKNF